MTKLTYTILVTKSPYEGQLLYSALEFCKAILKRGHCIKKLFFYHDASLIGSKLTLVPEDENNIHHLWQHFLIEQNLQANLCISASLRRGIMDDRHAQQFQKKSNLATCFVMTGLTDLLLAMKESDRFIQFGGSF